MEAKCSFHTCTSIGTGCKPDILKYPAPKTAELLRADAPTLRLFESFFLSLQNVPSGAVTTRQPSSAIETALRVAVIWGI
eukprot:s3247_g9.t2